MSKYGQKWSKVSQLLVASFLQFLTWQSAEHSSFALLSTHVCMYTKRIWFQEIWADVSKKTFWNWIFWQYLRENKSKNYLTDIRHSLVLCACLQRCHSSTSRDGINLNWFYSSFPQHNIIPKHLMFKSNCIILREKLFLYRYMYFYWWDQFEQVESGCSIGTHLVGPAPLFSLTHLDSTADSLILSLRSISTWSFLTRLTGAILSKPHFEHKSVGVSTTE